MARAAQVKRGRRSAAFEIVARRPTRDEFVGLIDAVGWTRYTNLETLPLALRSSLHCVVATRRGPVIGAGRLAGDGARNIYVQDIMVAPEHQRRGVGTAIMDALMAHINRHAPRKTYVHLFTEKKNAAFYARYGFRGPELFYGMTVKKFDEPLQRKRVGSARPATAAPRAGASGSEARAVSRITDVRCVLAVRNLKRSVKFYRQKLGFAVDFEAEGWAFLRRGRFRLMLGHCPHEVPAAKLRDHSWFAYVDVENVDGLYREFGRRRVKIVQELVDKPWGMREFGIVTPDGHRIVFGQNLG